MGLSPRGVESDEALMGRAQAGDADAFAALYDRHAERAFRVARAVCRDNGQECDYRAEQYRTNHSEARGPIPNTAH